MNQSLVNKVENLVFEKFKNSKRLIHILGVAKLAKELAIKFGLDADKAYVMGLLHDIGRRAGIKGILHIFDGYDYMMSLGQDEVALICLTHSFPIKNVNTFFGKYDCTAQQKEFLKEFVEQSEYNDYDILIQLCDAISLPNGACIMEKRGYNYGKRICRYTRRQLCKCFS